VFDKLSIFGAKYLFIVIGLIALVYFLGQPRSMQKRIVIFAAVTLPLIYIFSKIGGLLYDDQRPFVVGHFVPLISHEPDNGFPSDHVLLCAGIAAIIYPSSKRLSLVLWVLTLLVGLSRVHVGLHRPIDIIGSIGIAVVVATLAYFIMPSRWFATSGDRDSRDWSKQ
jgi:undecaprenyl-diphosphatase